MQSLNDESLWRYWRLRTCPDVGAREYWPNLIYFLHFIRIAEKRHWICAGGD